MEKDTSIAKHFGSNLALLLGNKLKEVYPTFKLEAFVNEIEKGCETSVTYTQRVKLLAETLKNYLPADFEEAAQYLVKVLGEENPNETGMFKHYYWILPIAKYVEECGLNHLEVSLLTIGEITKRSTGEYAIRPYLKKYPKETLIQMKTWALSENFHLRRLASEGTRPKLPWASKLDLFINEPAPVFEILEILKEDNVKFVQKSVANNLRDYLKVNPGASSVLLNRWQQHENKNTQWIVNHATRKGLFLQD